MPEPTGQKFVDHPAPSVTLVVMLMVTMFAVLLMTPLFQASYHGANLPIHLWILFGAMPLILLFYFWPIYTTYYTILPIGIEVRYGPWKKTYPWSDFTTVYWQKGMFGTRIGWPSVTPCVRLTNAVLLKRPHWLGLYLTPNDPRAFIQKIGEFAPQLTAETIL